MAVSFLEPNKIESRQAVAKLIAGDTSRWVPSDFREIMSTLAAELARGVFAQAAIDAAIVAVEAEEVDDLAQGFINDLEHRGVSCHLACFWMRRMSVRDAERAVIGVTGSSSQQYLDNAKGVETLIILQPVATRPDFVEFAINKFKYSNQIARVILVSPVYYPETLRSALDVTWKICGIEADIVAFDRADEETNVLRLTRFGSEGLLGTTRSDLKKRFFPEFAAYRMDNRPSPSPDDTRSRSFKLGPG